ncbi:hypothetical protein EXU85_03645 [Spirosoma sp. KCTC 42546]|uniref:hypothetical protein n=1 Tax=Spirosoma sp. KCTC 42546 TaxID=2520506 RepID=UPI0011580045|nr:hypothetical protein [Spirosoma sp. KCTC 42546]QDK77736.1 hypothetical protein EXU85_03645 [Spirosoma sp. KCTC 42546]
MSGVKIGLVIWGTKGGLQRFLTTVPDSLSKVKEEPYRDARSIFQGLPHFSEGSQPPILVTRLPNFGNVCISCYWQATDDLGRLGFLAISLLIPDNFTLNGEVVLNLLKQLTKIYWQNYVTGGSSIKSYITEDINLFLPVINKVELESIRYPKSPDSPSEKATMVYESADKLSSALTNLFEDEFASYQQLYLLPKGGTVSLLSNVVAPVQSIPEVRKRQNIQLEIVDERSGSSLNGAKISVEINDRTPDYDRYKANDRVIKRIKDTDRISLKIDQDGYVSKTIEPGDFRKGLTGDLFIARLTPEKIYTVIFIFRENSDWKPVQGVQCVINNNGASQDIKVTDNSTNLSGVKKNDIITINSWNTDYVQVRHPYTVPHDYFEDADRRGTDIVSVEIELARRSPSPVVFTGQPQEGTGTFQPENVNAGQQDNPTGSKSTVLIGDPNDAKEAGREGDKTSSGNNNKDGKGGWQVRVSKDTIMAIFLGLVGIFVISVISYIAYNEYTKSKRSYISGSGSTRTTTSQDNQDTQRNLAIKKLDSCYTKFYAAYSKITQEGIIAQIRCYQFSDSLIRYSTEISLDNKYVANKDTMHNRLVSAFRKVLNNAKIGKRTSKYGIQAGGKFSTLSWYSSHANFDEKLKGEFKADSEALASATPMIPKKTEPRKNTLVKGENKKGNQPKTEEGATVVTEVTDDKSNSNSNTLDDIVNTEVSLENASKQIGIAQKALPKTLDKTNNKKLQEYITYCALTMKIYNQKTRVEQKTYSEWKNQIDELKLVSEPFRVNLKRKLGEIQQKSN